MNKKRRNRKKKKIALVVGLATILVILIGVFIAMVVVKQKSKDDSNSNNTSSAAQMEEKNNVNQEGQESEKEAIAYEIDTKYCKLLFPKNWEKQVEVRYTEELGYKVEFWGLVKGKDACHIFDVCFNSDDGDLLGYLKWDEEIVNISIDIFDLEFDDTWEEKEMNQIYAMQEEINYVVNSLDKNKNYVKP